MVVDNSFYRDKTKIIIQNNNYIGKVNEYLKDIYLKIIFKNILWKKKKKEPEAEYEQRRRTFGEIGGVERPLVIGVLWKTNREDRDEKENRDEKTERERYLWWGERKRE